MRLRSTAAAWGNALASLACVPAYDKPAILSRMRDYLCAPGERFVAITIQDNLVIMFS